MVSVPICRGYLPVISEVLAGVQIGLVVQQRVKYAPFFAMRSILGVSAALPGA